jgi:AcrR family transcriptional regulator
MPVKQRAVADEDKKLRYDAIIATAFKLIESDHTRIPSVDDLAKHAGLAKGTVYLYFPSKEELLLAVHTENSRRFFTAFITLLKQLQDAQVEDLRPVVKEHMVDNATFLPMATRCLSLMDKELSADAVVKYKMLVSGALHTAAQDLVRHFPVLTVDESVRLLQHTYATVLGLWQIMHPVPRLAEHMHAPQLQCFVRDFDTEVAEAIFSLWYGRLARCEAKVVLPSLYGVPTVGSTKETQ